MTELDRGLEPGLRSPAPDVADRERKGVSRIGRSRRGRQPEQPGHHLGDLRLVGSPAAGHGSLDLARCVELHGYAVACCDDHRDAAGLRGAHDGADVVLAEDALDGNDIGPMLEDARLDLLLQLVQAAGDVEVRRRAEHTDVNHRQRSADRAVDDTHTAPGEARVNPEHSHGPTTVHTERMFDSLVGWTIGTMATRRDRRGAQTNAVGDVQHASPGGAQPRTTQRARRAFRRARPRSASAPMKIERAEHDSGNRSSRSESNLRHEYREDDRRRAAGAPRRPREERTNRSRPSVTSTRTSGKIERLLIAIAGATAASAA